MKNSILFTILKHGICLCVSLTVMACGSAKTHHTDPGTATYLGNEGIMLSHANTKVVFDPFFHNTYNTYQLVPEDIRNALFSGTPPYDNIDAIFISHAHSDHFSSGDVVRYLKSFPHTQLVAPKQAIDILIDLEEADELSERMHAIELAYQEKPYHGTLGDVSYDVVRIPHAGWPQRADIANLVFRVTLNNTVTVVHMGDADPNDEHFKPLIAHWEQQNTHSAFPPYWFLTNEDGKFILKQRIKAAQSIGIHVPVAVPQKLIDSKEKYFSLPGETASVNP